MNNELMSLVGIIGALSLGTISPGPSFVVVARTAVARSRSDGVAAAFGMGLGGLVFAAAALAGLQGVLIAVPPVYLALKIIGGFYLCYLGVRIISGARQAINVSSVSEDIEPSPIRSFLVGLGTQLSNPKTAIVYASVFAAFLPSGLSPQLGLVVLSAVFIIETVWYAIVAITLSSEKPRSVYLNYKAWIDRVAGAAMGALGIRLLYSVTGPEV